MEILERDVKLTQNADFFNCIKLLPFSSKIISKKKTLIITTPIFKKRIAVLYNAVFKIFPKKIWTQSLSKKRKIILK